MSARTVATVIGLLVLVVAAVSRLHGHGDTETTGSSVPSRTSTAASPMSASEYRDALDDLDDITVRGRGSMGDYDRDAFGEAWDDGVGDWKNWSHDGCSTRDDVLRRDLGEHAVIRPHSDGCEVTRGTFTEPYSGRRYTFVAGDDSEDWAGPHALDIDHVVALGDAWVSGASRWDDDKRARLANDPANLLAVSAKLNRQKGDANAASWLPPSKRFRCTYVTKQVEVKKSYGLSMTQPEHDAIERVLRSCV